MKKGLKGLLTGLCLAFALALTGCGGVSQSYADKINEAANNSEALTYEEVVKKLGDKYEGIYESTLTKAGVLVWYDGAENAEDAAKKVEDGKTVKVITVTFVGGKATAARYTELKKDEENK